MILVRVRGIEPRSQVWKTCILTAVLHPQETLPVYHTSVLPINQRLPANSLTPFLPIARSYLYTPYLCDVSFIP